MLSVHGDPLGVLGDPDTGGQCLYIKEIMKELVKQGHIVDSYSRRWGQKPKIDIIDKNERCRVIRLPCGSPDFIPKEKLKSLLPEFYDNLKSFIANNKLKYDVINSHYWDAGLVGTWMARDHNIPLVHTSHSLGAIKMASMPPNERLKYNERIKDEMKIYKDSSAVIAESNQENEDLKNIYNVKAEKIHIIPAGVDLKYFCPKGLRIEARKHLNLGDEIIVLSLGRLDPRKGFDLLVKTIPIVVSRFKSLRRKVKYYLSAGSINELNASEQEEYRKIMSICRDLDIEEHLEIIPRIEPLELVPYWYTAADVFTVPSRYETFGLVIVEAMGCKTPVVATNNGGPPDIITDGVEGYTVDPEDTNSFANRIIDCIIDSRNNLRMGENGRKTVLEKYTWEIVTKKIIAVYNSVISM